MVIKTLLTNRTAKFIGAYPDKLKELFGYVSPSAYFTPSYRHKQWDGIISFLKYGAVPTGLFLELRKKIEEEWEVEFDVVYARKKPKFRKLKLSDKSSRRFQNESVAAMIKASKVGGLIINATGTGKTYIAGKYFKALKGHGVFVVNELGLLKQAQDELTDVMKEPVGYIGNMKFMPMRITVATAQTMHKHRHDPKFAPWQKSLDVVIIDEIHEMLGRRNREIVSAIKPKACFGLTATLRHKKKHIKMKASALTGPIIYTFPLDKGVRQKYLVPGIVVAVNLAKAGHRHLDFWTEYDRVAACSKQYNDVLEKLIRAGVRKNKFSLLLVQRPKHIKILTKRLKDIPHGTAYGAIKVAARIEAKQQIEAKQIKTIIANQVFKKGTNIKRIDVIVDGASLPGWDDAQQKYGRGVRLCDNKRGLIYFDIGFKNPLGVTKKSFNYNRFERAARIRRRALKALRIPIYEVTWNGSAKRLLIFAQKKLDELLLKMKR